MAKGNFIRLGDKTTCGGTVMEADRRVMMFGFAHSREGDRVTCGKDGMVYVIVGGVSYISSHGRQVAGTLDSFSSCPCRARLIASTFKSSYESNQSITPRGSNTAIPTRLPETSTERNSAENAPVKPQTENSAATVRAVSSKTKEADPGFYIVQEPMSRATLESVLFENPDPAVLDRFRQLNPQLFAYAKPGQFIVLSDPRNSQCTREEALLMEAADKVNSALKPMSEEEASFMLRHRDEIEFLLSQGSTSIGIGEVIFAKHLDDVKNSLRDIEALHQRSFQRDGHLRSADFFAERKKLFAQLDSRLTFLTKKGIGFPDHPNLKAALGISSRSLVHHWSLAGAPGQIPGYATHSISVAKAAKYIKYGGWIGTTIGGGASYMKVQDVCTAGNTEACERIKYTEGGSFIGGVTGGAAAGAALTGAVVTTICIGLGVPTGGAATLLCGLIVIGTGSYAGGALVGAGGEALGEVVYRIRK